MLYKFDAFQESVIRDYYLRRYVSREDVIELMVMRLKHEMEEEGGV